MQEPAPIISETVASRLPEKLLAWYDRQARDLPWRVGPRDLGAGVVPNPYRVWLSEIMLQQTAVEAVKPYFRAFVERWPDIQSLAAADEASVMQAWAGLGYYSRARNLKSCAAVVAGQHGGRFPETEAELRKLPGIGAYTAAAVAAIAFGQPVPVVDGNVERVVSRLFALAEPAGPDKRPIARRLQGFVPRGRPGDFAQATMDLGATVCTPRRPRCMICPLRDDCAAARSGDPEVFPVRAAKATKPLRRGAAFVAVDPGGSVLLRTRPGKGLLGGMAEVPTSDWSARRDGEVSAGAAPFPAAWENAGTVRHVFTHFALELAVWRAEVGRRPAPPGHRWCAADRLGDEALPTLMRKVLQAAAPGPPPARKDAKEVA